MLLDWIHWMNDSKSCPELFFCVALRWVCTSEYIATCVLCVSFAGPLTIFYWLQDERFKVRYGILEMARRVFFAVRQILKMELWCHMTSRRNDWRTGTYLVGELGVGVMSTTDRIFVSFAFGVTYSHKKYPHHNGWPLWLEVTVHGSVIVDTIFLSSTWHNCSAT